MENYRDVPERKLAEMATERVLKRLSEAQRIGRIGDWEWDFATGSISWSPQVFEIVGRDPCLGPPRNHEENAAIFDSVSGAWLEAKFAAVIESGKAQEYEFLARRPDGKQVHIHVIASPTKDESGSVLGLHGTVQDITESKKANEALREREQAQRKLISLLSSETLRLNAAQALAKVGSWEIDLVTLAMIWSAETCKIFETDPDRFQPTYWGFWELVHPEDRSASEAAFAGSLSQGDAHSTHSFGYRLLLLSGRTKFVEARWKVFYDQQGLPDRAEGTVQDVTDRIRAEAATRRVIERLTEAQRIAKIGDWEWDIATQAITWSPEVFNIFGRDPRLGPPQSYEQTAEMHDAASKAILTAKVNRAIESGEAQDYELVMVRPGGEQVHVHAVAVPIKHESGRIISLHGTVQDITERHRAEEALRESQEALRLTLETAKLGYWNLDLLTRAANCSLLHNQIFGYEELLPDWSYEQFLSHVHPEDRARADQHVQRSVAEKTECDFECRIHRRDGALRWIWVHGNVFDSAGEARWMRGIVSDITERKQTEMEAARLVALLEYSHDAIIGNDLRGIVTSWNYGAEKLFGYSPSEMVGQPIARVIPPERQEEETRILGDIASGETVRHYETVRVHKDGSAMDVSVTVSVIKDPQGKIIGSSKLARDITAEKRTAQALKDSELRYRRLFETAKDGILILDAETGMVVDVNPFLITLLGFPYETFLEKRVWELGFFRDLLANHEKFVELREKEYVRYEDLPLETVHGQRIEVEFISNVYRVNGSKVIQCNVRDVTARRRAEKSLRELSKRMLQAENEERRRIANELHNSTAQDLFAVMMNLGLLHDMLGDREKKAADLVADSVALMESSLTDIRTLCYTLHPPRLDETGLAGALPEYAAGFGRRADIRVKVECPADFPRLPEEAEVALFRVVQESLGNVLRHSGSDSAVVRLKKEDHRVILEVTDWGCGLSSEMMRQSPGARGVGIAAMRERMQQIGGTLELNSSALGVTVCAVFPLPKEMN